MSKKNVIFGALAGLAAGAILGILFAPAKGTETRRKIADQGNELGEFLKKKLDEILDSLTGDPITASEEKPDDTDR